MIQQNKGSIANNTLRHGTQAVRGLPMGGLPNMAWIQRKERSDTAPEVHQAFVEEETFG